MSPPFDVDREYRRYGPMVFRRCYQLLGDEPRAMDAMQDTFVQLVRYRRQLSNEAPASLLNRIATNVCLNVLRGGRTRGTTVDTSAITEIARSSEAQSIASQFLTRLFENEHQSTRVIAVLHYVDGMTLDEVSTEVGLSVSGVRKRLRKLKSQIPSLHEVP